MLQNVHNHPNNIYISVVECSIGRTIFARKSKNFNLHSTLTVRVFNILISLMKQKGLVETDHKIHILDALTATKLRVIGPLFCLVSILLPRRTPWAGYKSSSEKRVYINDCISQIPSPATSSKIPRDLDDRSTLNLIKLSIAHSTLSLPNGAGLFIPRVIFT